jgi:hypothetical protein
MYCIYPLVDKIMKVVIANLISLILPWMEGLGLWCLTPLSTIFQLYRGSQSVLLVEEIGVPRENH